MPPGVNETHITSAISSVAAAIQVRRLDGADRRWLKVNSGGGVPAGFSGMGAAAGGRASDIVEPIDIPIESAEIIVAVGTARKQNGQPARDSSPLMLDGS